MKEGKRINKYYTYRICYLLAKYFKSLGLNPIEARYHSQKYCDWCRNYQDNYYVQLEKECVVKFIGGKYKFV